MASWGFWRSSPAWTARVEGAASGGSVLVLFDTGLSLDTNLPSSDLQGGTRLSSSVSTASRTASPARAGGRRRPQQPGRQRVAVVDDQVRAVARPVGGQVALVRGQVAPLDPPAGPPPRCAPWACPGPRRDARPPHAGCRGRRQPLAPPPPAAPRTRPRRSGTRGPRTTGARRSPTTSRAPSKGRWSQPLAPAAKACKQRSRSARS